MNTRRLCMLLVTLGKLQWQQRLAAQVQRGHQEEGCSHPVVICVYLVCGLMLDSFCLKGPRRSLRECQDSFLDLSSFLDCCLDNAQDPVVRKKQKTPLR